ncbi:hypothetical protein AMS68_006332 [Peltaster fructicola]|uniref:C2H2 type master regulator of conidiophore development brlA n=1 Tax=Peltaster fructicola TaxID=286661 RepID=A0A6H0Y1M2_9PEZI|nr:hypothetical protein AMS68_006332 [Peltaster fructicola]
MSEPGYMHDAAELYYAGTQLSSAVDYPSAHFQQDVDQSLGESSFEDTQGNDELWSTTFDPFAQTIMGSSFDTIRPLARTDSGLNARARPFIPASQQSSRINTTTVPARTTQLLQQQLTPIRTNFDTYQTPPYSAPCYQQDGNPNDVSPLLTITDAMHRTQIHSSNGYQWPLDVAPAQQIDTWVGTSTYGAQLGPDFIDPAYLTPTTPVSHCSSGSGRSRSHSIASATSYHCDHHGCGKDFKTKTEYTHHRRNHGDRNHACSHCSKRFVFRKDLNRHIKTHTPEQRYYFCQMVGCQWGERGFQRKDHYDRHMRTHAPRSTGMLTPVTTSAPMSRCTSGR